MNVSQFFSRLREKWYVIVVWVAALVAVALIATWQLPQTYDAGSTITANRNTGIKQENVNYYLYDNYYTIQSGSFLADNVVSWLASPPIVATIYSNAGLDLPNDSIKALAKVFAAKKLSANSNVVTYTVTTGDADSARKLVVAANHYINELVDQVNSDQKDTTTYFSINYSDPVVIKSQKSYTLNALLAGVLGVLIACATLVYTPSKK